jgi:hypothetical protein
MESLEDLSNNLKLTPEEVRFFTPQCQLCLDSSCIGNCEEEERQAEAEHRQKTTMRDELLLLVLASMLLFTANLTDSVEQPLSTNAGSQPAAVQPRRAG